MDDRMQWAIEQITGDSSLTEYLDDAEAARLLEWGVGCARQLVLHTVEMDAFQADEYLEQHLQDLRRVIRRTGRLVGELADCGPDEIAESLQRISETASQVPVLRWIPPEDIQIVAEELQAAPASAALERILSYLSAGEEQ